MAMPPDRNGENLWGIIRCFIAGMPSLMRLAFYLICIDTVWLVGALQDNKALYWLSIAVRGANAVLFVSFGGKWAALAGAAAVTAGIMSAAMLSNSRKGGSEVTMLIESSLLLSLKVSFNLGKQPDRSDARLALHQNPSQSTCTECYPAASTRVSKTNAQQPRASSYLTFCAPKTAQPSRRYLHGCSSAAS
jgi:hypothetical protein